MRYLLVTPAGILDTLTGELSESLEPRLLQRPGGIIAGRNLYPVLAPIAAQLRRDHGWTATISAQRQRAKEKRVKGLLYFSHLTYRFAKIRSNGRRYRPGSIKWLVLNLELFSESTDIEGAARALVALAERRGIRARHSPGSFGGALLRASEAWEDKRRPAPRFVSAAAREVMPGNLYALRHGYRGIKRGYYLDQKSSHHTVSASIPLPHPHFLRARGRFRAVERGEFPKWLDSPHLLRHHYGVIAAVVECRRIAPTKLHLYPPWAQTPGRRMVWIWTPELRLLDVDVQLVHISASLTSFKLDPILLEYAEWALAHLATHPHSAVKPALLAAYGMLAVKSGTPIVRYSVHGRTKPPRAESCTLPLLDNVYRSTVEQRRTPSLQNVVARGVIEAEVRTRSLEMARRLEGDGIPVVHIYADGLIADCGQLPFLPPDWRCVTALTDVSAANPSTITSRELVRLPGIPDGRRTAYVRSDTDAELEAERSAALDRGDLLAALAPRRNHHLREREPSASM
jgi:hypothetical protein